MSELAPTFQRCPHDKENPYALISRELIRDKTISPRCRWFLMYCLSYPNGWKISIPYFIKEQGISKEIIYKIIKEAIESGYMMRDLYSEKGLRRYRYYISESPKFKKSLPCPENPDLDRPDTENPDSKKEESSSVEEEKKYEQKNPPPPPKFMLKKKEGVFSKESIRKQLSEYDDVSFEKAWNEYKKAPLGSVRDIKSWLKGVMMRHEFEDIAKSQKKARISKHRLQATELAIKNFEDRKKKPNMQHLNANKDHLEMTFASHCKIINYDVSDQVWDLEIKKLTK